MEEFDPAVQPMDDDRAQRQMRWLRARYEALLEQYADASFEDRKAAVERFIRGFSPADRAAIRNIISRDN